MKVGIFLGNDQAVVGGGHTFEADVYRAFLDLAAQSRHSFTVFARLRAGAPTGPVPENVEVVPYLSRTIAGRALSKARREVISWLTGTKVRTRAEKMISESGVEFIWNAYAWGPQTDVPYIATVWDLQHRRQPWFPEVSAGGQWRRREAFHAEYLQRATYVIAGTRAGRDEIGLFYGVPDERIKILPHPTPSFALNAGEVNADPAATYGLPERYVFYPAQFWSHKNHANLLLALAELHDVHRLDVPAVFVGNDYGNEAYVRRLVHTLGLTDRVHFLGFVPQDDLVALYRGALALTYVTFFGPENLPPLEAFALGCPVIASRVAGSEEQLGDAALLVDPTDPAAIADAIKRVHADGELRKTLIEHGKARALRWTSKDLVRGVFELFDDFEPYRRCWK